MTHNFDHIRPYTDEEVPSVLQDVIHDSFFPMVVNYLYPNADLTTLQKELSAIRSVKEFQSKVMHSAIGSVLQKTSTGLSSEGFSLLDNGKRHMFVANHRDIVLDAAILDVLLYDNGIDTCQITFGDNLMKGDLVVHIGKLNKMFKIVRGGNIRGRFPPTCVM